MASSLLFGWFVTSVLVKKTSELPADAGPPPDLRLWYSPADLHDLFDSWGPGLIAQYRADRFRFDLQWPVVYTLFYATLWAWWTRRVLAADHPLRGRLGWTIVLAPFVLDLVENTCMYVAAGMHPEQSIALVTIGTLATLSKWLAVGVVSLVTLFGLGAVVRLRLQRSRGSNQSTGW